MAKLNLGTWSETEKKLFTAKEREETKIMAEFAAKLIEARNAKKISQKTFEIVADCLGLS